MNSFKVTIQFYDKPDTVYTKQTKWHSPHRLAQHYMAKMRKQDIQWRTLTVEWEARK